MAKQKKGNWKGTVLFIGLFVVIVSVLLSNPFMRVLFDVPTNTTSWLPNLATLMIVILFGGSLLISKIIANGLAYGDWTIGGIGR